MSEADVTTEIHADTDAFDHHAIERDRGPRHSLGRTSKGTVIGISIICFLQMVNIALTGFGNSKQNEALGTLTTISMHRAAELQSIQTSTASAKKSAADAAAVLTLLLRLEAASRHPGEIGQSIEFQVCRAIDGIDHALHIKPGCRIP